MPLDTVTRNNKNADVLNASFYLHQKISLVRSESNPTNLWMDLCKLTCANNWQSPLTTVDVAKCCQQLTTIVTCWSYSIGTIPESGVVMSRHVTHF